MLEVKAGSVATPCLRTESHFRLEAQCSCSLSTCSYFWCLISCLNWRLIQDWRFQLKIKI